MCMYLRSSPHPNGSLCNECHTEIWKLFWQHERASGIILGSMKEIWGSFWQHGKASGVILGIMTKIWKPFWQHERASEVILGSTREIWEAFWAAWESLSSNFGLHEREHKWLHESTHAIDFGLHERELQREVSERVIVLSCNRFWLLKISASLQDSLSCNHWCNHKTLTLMQPLMLSLMQPKITPEALSCNPKSVAWELSYALSHATQNRLHESSHATTYALSCNPKLPDRLSHAAQNASQIFLMLPKMTPEALSCRQNGSQIFFLLPEMIPEAFT